MSLRGRVLAYLVLSAIAALALTVGFGTLLIRRHVASQQLAQLRATAETLAFTSGHPLAQRAGTHVYRVDVRHRHAVRGATAAAVLREVSANGDAQGTIGVAGRAFLYVARDTANGRIVLLRRATVRFAQFKPFLEAIVLAGVAGALFAVLLSLVLARRLTRPIDELARATERLAAGDAEVAVPVRGDDELTGLGRAFNAMAQELTRTREGQRVFLESVSHELKTPLTSVRGYAEALADDAIDPPEAGRVIAAEAGRLQRLVADLLDLARLGRSDFAVGSEPVDLGAVAAEAVIRHEVRARELGVTLSHSRPPAADLVRGDGERLLQATSNLVENALRLTPAGGSVVVDVDGTRLSVCDDGPGLADADLGRAFERFYLYDRYRADPGRAVGSGLGLAIVARLVTAMGGSVAAENRPGGGARFSIVLPANGDSDATRAASTPRSRAR